ncbi:MAG: response regulator, partial [Lachnospiraceae bacterium]|nr:response regulator [Lachnospiraceae bacterium]
VDQALSGKEGIELCAKNKYDLILLDHMMPGMDGIETLHRLKEDPDFDSPVIALTANAIEGMREMYLSEGFDDYLTKPTKPEDLERTLSEYLPKDKVKTAGKTE